MIEHSELMSDEELVMAAQQDFAEAFELLLVRYKPLVRRLAGQYFLTGGDHDDLIQEGMIGLFKAVRLFDIRVGNPFSALAKTTVHNAIIDALRRDQAGKQRTLNESKSLSQSESYDGFVQDAIEAEAMAHSPEAKANQLDRIEAREAAKEIATTMSQTLSNRELQVLMQSLKGLSTAEIAKRLKLEEKQTISALARARKKLRDKLLT